MDGSSRGRDGAGPARPAVRRDVPRQLGVAPRLSRSRSCSAISRQGPHAVQFKTRLPTSPRSGASSSRALPTTASIPCKLKPAVAIARDREQPRRRRGVRRRRVARRRTAHARRCLRRARGWWSCAARRAGCVQRLVVNAGDRAKVEGRLKPAFALLPGADPWRRRPVRRSSRRRAGPGGLRNKSRSSSRRGGTGDAASSDRQGRPSGSPSTRGGARWRGRRHQSPPCVASCRPSWPRALDVQGVAAISQPTPTSPDLVIALLAAGAGEPDVVSLVPERMDSVTGGHGTVRLRSSAARGRRSACSPSKSVDVPRASWSRAWSPGAPRRRRA